MPQNVCIFNKIMSKKINICSVDGNILESLNVEYSDKINWWMRDILSLLDEIDGLTTWRACQMISEYLWDTEWMTTTKRSVSEIKNLSKVRSTLYDSLDALESNCGVISIE